ncbi:MAG: APC family permease [Dehalococcoidia bacterium]
MTQQPGGGPQPATPKRARRGSLPGARYVQILRPFSGRFVRSEPGALVATEAVFVRESRVLRWIDRAWRFLVGSRLPTEMEAHERLGTVKGLAVFASDNISSSAYATEEIMRVLILAGAGALTLTMPITLAIVAVLAIVVTSYRQTINAYPNGGGSYIVASDNLGHVAGLVAGASLLSDYVLTVAVSVAAGVAALTSLFPSLLDERVPLALLFVWIICLGNLRGIRESGTIFAAPAYLYLLAVFGLLAYGLFRTATGTLPVYVPTVAEESTTSVAPLGLLLLLRAFSSGAVALTGVEAVSNGIPAFRAPETRHAQQVLLLMGSSFAVIFIGMSFLAGRIGVTPDPTEATTVVSQIAAALVGAETPYHYFVQLSTALLLVLAANTAFADFPRLSSILAKDGFWPRQFQYRGDRLAFSTGIIVLTVLSTVLLYAFDASVTALIPLYTVGVFVAFSLSQSGMVRHWWRLRGELREWWRRAAVNAIGATATGVVALVVGVSKFALGAWMVLVLVPILMGLMLLIHGHYERVRALLALAPGTLLRPTRGPSTVIVPVSRLNRPTLRALEFAFALGPDVRAVHVSDDRAAAAQMRRDWEALETGLELTIIESPYRSLIPPLLAYIDAARAVADEPVVVVLAEFVPEHLWQNVLHNQAALRLKGHLFGRPNTIVVDVPMHLEPA